MWIITLVNFLYPLDLLGTFAFAVYGSYIGFKKGFDIFGIFVCAFLCGLGGGTIREMILNRLPAYFTDYNYIYVVVIGILFCNFTYHHFHKINKFMLILDAVGLTTFAYIGASRAVETHLGIVGAMLFAPLTAVGGGTLKDIVANEIPDSFKGQIYASPAIISGVLYYIFKDYISNPFATFSLILFIFLIRVAAIQYKVVLRSKKDVYEFFKKINEDVLKPAFLFRR